MSNVSYGHVADDEMYVLLLRWEDRSEDSDNRQVDIRIVRYKI
jgi:hypothetical protein